MKPMMFNYWETVDDIVNVIKIGLFALFLCSWLAKCFGKRNYSQGTIIVILMHLTILVSTVMHHGNLYRWAVEMLSPVSIALFLDLYIDDFRSIIRIWSKFIIIFLIINVITLITGGYQNDDWLIDYFLGSKNTFAAVFSMYIVILYLQYFFERHFYKKMIFCIGLMLIAIVVTLSTTMVISAVVFSSMWFLKNNSLFRKFIQYKYLLPIYLLLNVVMLSPDYWDLYINYLDANLEKGSSSFLPRLYMWEGGLKIFMENPILGIGKMTEDIWVNHIEYAGFHFQLHNQIVEYMATGGIILISLLLLLYTKVAICFKNTQKNDFAYILTIVCFTVNVSTLSEGKYGGDFLIVFLLVFYLHRIVTLKNTMYEP